MIDQDFDKTTSIKTNAGQHLQKLKKFDVLELSYNSKTYPIVGEITIGRDFTNHIVIEDTLASRCHAVIQKIQNEYFLKDLNSTNGTLINEAEVPTGKYFKLKKNDILRIGRTELTVR